MRFLALASAIALSGCAQSTAHYPVLADVSPEADARVDVIDRTVVLADAVDADLAPRGGAMDLADAGAAFALDASRMTDTGVEGRSDNPYANVLAGAIASTSAYAITVGVFAPPAIAIGLVAEGQVHRVAENVWQVQRTVPVGGQQVTGTFTVAWVAVGWLAEMRLKTEDGTWNDDLWFTGFVGPQGGIAWWDLYDRGDLVGVIEWLGDGQGNAHLGLSALDGPHAGSGISWLFTEEGVARVDAVDGVTEEHAWVQHNADDSGEVRLPEFNEGEPACWDVDLTNTPCAE
jgi:hypothetical protein